MQNLFIAIESMEAHCNISPLINGTFNGQVNAFSLSMLKEQMRLANAGDGSSYITIFYMNCIVVV